MKGKVLAVVIGAAGYMGCGSSSPPLPLPPPPAASEPEISASISHVDLYPQREVSFECGARGLADVVYSALPGYRPLAMDLYLPPWSVTRPEAGFPLIVHVHGGAWNGGDRRHSGPFVDFPQVLAQIASRGYVVASIDYRSSSEAPFPAQEQDVKTAIRWLRANAKTYDIDPARAVTWGESAGAHLAALAALACNAPPLEPPSGPDGSDCVQGSVAWFGVFDLATIAKQARDAKAATRDAPDAPEWRLLGCIDHACLPERLAMASPATYVDAHDPPMLLIAGDDDHTVPVAQTLEMARVLEQARVSHNLIMLPKIDNDFLSPSREMTKAATLRALEATLSFFDETLRK